MQRICRKSSRGVVCVVCQSVFTRRAARDRRAPGAHRHTPVLFGACNCLICHLIVSDFALTEERPSPNCTYRHGKLRGRPVRALMDACTRSQIVAELTLRATAASPPTPLHAWNNAQCADGAAEGATLSDQHRAGWQASPAAMG